VCVVAIAIVVTSTSFSNTVRVGNALSGIIRVLASNRSGGRRSGTKRTWETLSVSTVAGSNLVDTLVINISTSSCGARFRGLFANTTT
jgi:hypothetical protein